jgi:hypothetical protein
MKMIAVMMTKKVAKKWVKIRMKMTMTEMKRWRT